MSPDHAAREVVELVQPPSLVGLYARGAAGSLRAALGRNSSGEGRADAGRAGAGRADAGRAGAGPLPDGVDQAGDAGRLPDTEHLLRSVPVDADRLTAYQHHVGEPAGDVLPPGFVHVLAFPVALSVMARPDFPLPVVGMVHLANRIEQHRPARLGATLTVRAWAEGLGPHRRGTQVDLRAEVADEDGLLWSGTSTYLAKSRRPVPTDATDADADADDTAATDPAPANAPGQPTAVWHLPADTGRRYAAITGDRNPIHLSALTARAFGFRRAIAHGMDTAARALASAGPRPEAGLVWDVGFSAPVLLPATVHLRVEQDEARSVCTVWDARSGREHLRSTVHV